MGRYHTWTWRAAVSGPCAFALRYRTATLLPSSSSISRFGAMPESMAGWNLLVLPRRYRQLSFLCNLLGADHKNSKRWIAVLQDKLAIEVVRQPDFRNAIPTRYRVFSYTQIMDRRRQAGMLWVVRTRTVRFVDLAIVNQLLNEEPMGQSPMDHLPAQNQLSVGQSAEEPAGESPQSPMGRSPVALLIKESKTGTEDKKATSTFPCALAASINQWLIVDDDVVRQIWESCRRGTPDCTEDEVAWFCRSKEGICRSGRIDSPAGLLIRSVPKFFLQGGGAALLEYRKERMKEEERRRQSERQAAQITLTDPEVSEEERAWAEGVLQQDDFGPSTTGGGQW